MEVGDLAEGFVLFHLESQIKVQRLFRLEVGIAVDLDVHPGVRRMMPREVQLTRRRGAVRRADVRLEAHILRDLVRCAELARELVAKFAVVVPTKRRNDQPAR